MEPMPLLIVEVICARVTLERAVVVRAEALPPCRLAPWHSAQFAEYNAAGSIDAAAVVTEAVLDAVE